MDIKNATEERPVAVVLGLQWGDEGKGKIVDFILKKYSLVARFQGGANAGHSIKVGDTTYVFHIVPSGILHKDIYNLVGAGVVLDPTSLEKEIAEIKNVAPWWKENLFIANEATLTLPTHKLLDKAEESGRASSKIGTTQKGIGPTYTDFYARSHAIFVEDIMLGDEIFKQKYEEVKNNHLRIIQTLHNYNIDQNELDTMEKEFFQAIAFMKGLQFVSCHDFMFSYINAGKKILAEGAQGTLLDVRFGTRPNVTSSNTITAGVCTGLGVPPHVVGDVYGVFKAYTTRVGSGPFPTEFGGEDAAKWASTHTRTDEEKLAYDVNNTDQLQKGIALRKLGFEYGATTGRPRRCGALDLPLLKYAIAINGVNKLVMTKSDIIDTMEEIPVCVAYEGLEHPNLASLETMKPVYKTFKGWNSKTYGMNTYEQLPQEAKDYIAFIESEVGVPVSYISTGPERDEIIVR